MADGVGPIEPDPGDEPMDDCERRFVEDVYAMFEEILRPVHFRLILAEDRLITLSGRMAELEQRLASSRDSAPDS